MLLVGECSSEEGLRWQAQQVVELMSEVHPKEAGDREILARVKEGI